MENEKEKSQPKKQCFYFKENGQLVVESNKGVWVDGEQFVKMYGDFTCNAKTMGIIISQLKGMPAFVTYKQTYDRILWSSAECLINPSVEQAGLLSKISKKNDEIDDLKKSIYDFNRLPWWKRIFKKIEVK